MKWSETSAEIPFHTAHAPVFMMLGSFAGNVPVCGPKIAYECAMKRLWQYVRDNEVANCQCPRQCRRLQYIYSNSQAKVSNFVVRFAQQAFQLEGTVEEIANNYCSLEVCVAFFSCFFIAVLFLCSRSVSQLHVFVNTTVLLWSEDDHIYI